MDNNVINNIATPATFLASRRSSSPKLFTGPLPDHDTLNRILTSGLRVPDHKGLQPWRLIVLRENALTKLSCSIEHEAMEQKNGNAKWLRIANLYRNAKLVVCVVYSPIEQPEVPKWEQLLSAGSVCLSLVNASLSEGFAAAWLSGPPTESRSIMNELDIMEHEKIVGLVHIGSCKNTPSDRPRANISGKVSYRD
ncbi:nitroreductase [Amylibacter sp. SFDW26]|uniref:nitroreductase family protein n=1 Tax=Amylibacter sp. SFDW26 TaxID=2652722 RepID=UPI0012625FE2|nr:nitroreductase [Amylibacter sp. SFDW26]KAB7610273.1 nitroreductase [Amylibacter sp. SFDW26]